MSQTVYTSAASEPGCTLLPVREPQWGIIFKPWDDQPVYHRRDPDYRNLRTICGRRIGMWTPWLPFKHVKKIGRPCKGCFDA